MISEETKGSFHVIGFLFELNIDINWIYSLYYTYITKYTHTYIHINKYNKISNKMVVSRYVIANCSKLWKKGEYSAPPGPPPPSFSISFYKRGLYICFILIVSNKVENAITHEPYSTPFSSPLPPPIHRPFFNMNFHPF